MLTIALTVLILVHTQLVNILHVSIGRPTAGKESVFAFAPVCTLVNIRGPLH